MSGAKKNSFGSTLTPLLEAKGWYANELAKKIGKSPSYLGNMTKEDGRPSSGLILEISEAMSLNASETERLLWSGADSNPKILREIKLHRKVSFPIDVALVGKPVRHLLAGHFGDMKSRYEQVFHRRWRMALIYTDPVRHTDELTVFVGTSASQSGAATGVLSIQAFSTEESLSAATLHLPSFLPDVGGVEWWATERGLTLHKGSTSDLLSGRLKRRQRRNITTKTAGSYARSSGNVD